VTLDTCRLLVENWQHGTHDVTVAHPRRRRITSRRSHEFKRRENEANVIPAFGRLGTSAGQSGDLDRTASPARKKHSLAIAEPMKKRW